MGNGGRWYSIMTDEVINKDNIILVGKKELLHVAWALIKMVVLGRGTTVTKRHTKSINPK